jgi:hypothetical protein
MAGSRQFTSELLEAGLIASGEDDRCAYLRQLGDNGATDAAAPSRNNGNLA